MFIEVDVKDVAAMKAFFGTKTINQIRQEHGLTTVDGGEQVYVDWLEKNFATAKPKLKIVAGPEYDA